MFGQEELSIDALTVVSRLASTQLRFGSPEPLGLRGHLKMKEYLEDWTVKPPKLADLGAVAYRKSYSIDYNGRIVSKGLACQEGQGKRRCQIYLLK